MDRRRFVKASVSSLAAAGLLKEIPAWAQPGLVRRDVTSQAAAGDLDKYRRAVTEMKNKQASDPLSWESWAQVHNNHCPHTNWWFLPWHRAYIYYFEQVCQQVISDTTFRLPYWDWSANQTIPQPFLDPNSKLFNNTRRSNTVAREAVNQALINDIVQSPSELDMFSGSASTQRGSGQTGRFEGTPHNTVHRNIGGDMVTLLSPRDPIFWMHHCNIDRIWASWQRIGGHNSPSQSSWKQLALASFYDPVNRRQVSPVTDTVPSGQYALPYDRYVTPPRVLANRSLAFREFELNGAAAALPNEISGMARDIKPVSLGSGLSVPVTLSGLQKLGPLGFRAEAAPLRAPAAASVSEAYLLIEDIPWPSDPDISLRVFLNAGNPTPATPVTDPSYVGTISFFGMPMKNTFALNLTAALARKLNGGGDTVQVGLVAVDLLHPERVSTEAYVRPAALKIVALSEKL